MLNVLLLCADSTESAIFSRMLSLSLAAQGCEVKKCAPTAPITTEAQCPIVLLDADVLSPEALCTWVSARACIVYSTDKISLPQSALCCTAVFVRPFDVTALCATVQAICAQEFPTLSSAPTQQASLSAADALSISEAGVFFGNESVPLTARERELLQYLWERRGTVCTRQELLENVWHYDATQNKTNVVDVYVRYLRAKIDHAFDVRLICAVRNGGYMIR